MSNEDMRRMITVLSLPNHCGFKVAVTVTEFDKHFSLLLPPKFGQQQAWSNCSASHILRPSCVPGQNFEAKKVFLYPPTL